MRKIFKKLSKTDWFLIAIYWVIAYIYIIPAYFLEGKIFQTFLISIFETTTRTFLAIVLLFLLFPGHKSIKNIILALFKGTILISFFTPLFIIANAYYNNSTIDWSVTLITKNILIEAQAVGLLCTILAMKKFYDIQQYTYKLEKLNTENQLKALNNQVSPHFLFNNLNVLSGLISQNPVEANKYLNKLAMVYRHLITNVNNDIVLLLEELSFADDYIYLLEQRFENAYLFTKEGMELKNYNKYLPTCSLQLVLENIIKHNKGDNLNPLHTIISITDNHVTITNQKRLKEQEFENTGIGLMNLRNRYELLSDKQIEITITESTYTIKLPLLNATTHIK
jgi:two-component system, LytTR family, sensor kinase